jgi:hypothetical protein
MGIGVGWERSTGISSSGKASEGAVFSFGAGVRAWPWAMSTPASKLPAKASDKRVRGFFFMVKREEVVNPIYPAMDHWVWLIYAGGIETGKILTFINGENPFRTPGGEILNRRVHGEHREKREEKKGVFFLCALCVTPFLRAERGISSKEAKLDEVNVECRSILPDPTKHEAS